MSVEELRAGVAACAVEAAHHAARLRAVADSLAVTRGMVAGVGGDRPHPRLTSVADRIAAVRVDFLVAARAVESAVDDAVSYVARF